MRPDDHDLLVAGLFGVFGLGSWITVNGLFAELPLFYKDLPEREAIGSYIGLVVQFANLGPVRARALVHRVDG